MQEIHQAAPVGRRLRVQIKARDVSLAREKPRCTSILNLVPATVVAITDRDANSIALYFPYSS